MNLSPFKASVLTLVLLAFAAIPALAQEDGAIKHRQSVMKAVGGHMGAMADLAKIAARVFPEGSDFGETRAKEESWSKPKEFAKVIQVFITESGKLAKVAGNGDVNAFIAQFQVMGKNACGACHKQFREKKQ